MLDICPTVLDLLGLPFQSEPLVGRSLERGGSERVILSVFVSDVAIRYARRTRDGYRPTNWYRSAPGPRKATIGFATSPRQITNGGRLDGPL
jgi:hypothetical protein